MRYLQMQGVMPIPKLSETSGTAQRVATPPKPIIFDSPPAGDGKPRDDSGVVVCLTDTDRDRVTSQPPVARSGAASKFLGMALLGVGVGLVGLGMVRSGPSIVAPISTAAAASPTLAVASPGEPEREVEVASAPQQLAGPVSAAADLPVAPAEDALGVDDAQSQLLIDAAVGRGEVERYEGIVYASQGKLAFADAQQACDTLTLAGADWRLARLSELYTLVGAKRLAQVSFWSQTEVDQFGTRALVWQGRHMRASPVGKLWTGARGVCVLDEPAR